MHLKSSTLVVLGWLLLCLLAMAVAQGNSGGPRRRLRQGRRGMRMCNCRRWIRECQPTCQSMQTRGDPGQDSLNSLNEMRRLLANSNSSLAPNLDLSRFVPTLPAPEDVECYVEVQQTRLVGGRCKQFGRLGQRACEAGTLMELNSPECQEPNDQGRRSGPAGRYARGRRNSVRPQPARQSVRSSKGAQPSRRPRVTRNLGRVAPPQPRRAVRRNQQQGHRPQRP